jgi:CheY-like chemotaxis protein
MRLALEANRPFRIVLLDMRMPAMDGIEVALRIRRQKLPGQPLILMLSSEDFKPQLPRVRELGLDAYMVKPITRKRLFEAIGRVLSDPGHHAPGTAASREVAEPADAPPPPVAVSNILIADDSPDNRLLIAAYLKNEPYRIEFAENGKVAIEKFTANRYDVVFMDVQMPEMDGLNATRIIRQWERDHGRGRTPIVALSAAALEEDVKHAIEAGCDLHVSKPVKKRVMVETIRHIASLRPDQPTAALASAGS